jgi:hypothetical protein
MSERNTGSLAICSPRRVPLNAIHASGSKSAIVPFLSFTQASRCAGGHPLGETCGCQSFRRILPNENIGKIPEILGDWRLRSTAPEIWLAEGEGFELAVRSFPQ